MNNTIKVALALVVMLGVLAIAAGTVVGAAHPQKFHEPEPSRTCAYSSGCQYVTVP